MNDQHKPEAMKAMNDEIAELREYREQAKECQSDVEVSGWADKECEDEK